MSAKLDRLTALIESLEKLAGLNPDLEVIMQREDGTWPEPLTNAPIIAERVRFTRSPAQALADRTAQLAAAVDTERQAFERTIASPVARRAWRVN
jgi:hypothetical protein